MYDLNHGTHLIECLVCLFMSRINWHIFSDVYLKQSIYQLKCACTLKYFYGMKINFSDRKSKQIKKNGLVLSIKIWQWYVELFMWQNTVGCNWTIAMTLSNASNSFKRQEYLNIVLSMSYYRSIQSETFEFIWLRKKQSNC